MSKDDFMDGMAGEAVKPTAPKPSAPPAKAAARPPAADEAFRASLDTAFAEVLKCDKEGRLVRFACEPTAFLRLSDEQVDQLSAMTRGAYLDAERTYRRALEEAANPSFVKGPIVQGSSARARIRVRNLRPGMHGAWKRPEEHQQALYEGYQVSHDESVDTFSKGPSSVRTVGAMGDPELVLYEIPEAVFQERLKANERVSQERVRGAKAAGVAELRGAGAEVYDPDANPQADARRSWQDRAPDEGR